MKQTDLTNQLLDFAETILDDDHSLSIKMQGYSMYPTLRAGDVGNVQKCVPEDLKIGDIIVFRSNNKLVAHRLIQIKSTKGIRFYLTKGDKNYHFDPPFTDESLVGILKTFTRKNRVIKIDALKMKIQRFNALHLSKISILFFDTILRILFYWQRLKTNLQSIQKNLAFVGKGSKKELTLNIIIAVFQGVLPFLVIVCIKALIDVLTKSTAFNKGEQQYFIFLLVITAAVFLINAILIEIRSYFSEKLSQSVTRRIFSILHKKHASLDLSHYENPAEQDKIHRAVQEASFRPIKILNEFINGIRSIAAALFMLILFVSIKWYLVVLLVASIIPSVFVRLKYSQKRYALKESQSTKEREMYYFNRVLTGFPFAKEMKLFGFSSFFLKRFSGAQDVLFDEKLSLRKTEIRAVIYSEIFAIVLIFISLGYVSLLKINGLISIGTVVLFFFAFQRGYGVLNELFKSFTQLIEDNTFLNDFMAFLTMSSKSADNQLATANFSLQKEIEIKDVSFKYESSKREALSSINIRIPAGKTVAFVGANGSGKTTLIKLLCGFYQPHTGSIMYDGVDALSVGQTKICENITAVFQDFALYNVAAFENIGLGNISAEFDLDRAKQAAKSAGIDHVIEKLPSGYATLLGNLFKTGEELSIGQWQKIAIARAFYRDSALLLMDEPSSALDAISEQQIISSLKELSQDKTAIIISHRLSTVQWADTIYFFDEGKIVESGTHEELLALKAKYYSLYKSSKSSN